MRRVSLALSLLLLLGSVAGAQDDSDILDPTSIAPSGGSTPPAQPVQQPQRGPQTPQRPVTDGRQQPSTPASDDDDILDPDAQPRPPARTLQGEGTTPAERPLEEVRQQGQAPRPPSDPAEKERLDAGVREEIAPLAEQFGQERRRIETASPTEASRLTTAAVTDSEGDLSEALRDVEAVMSEGARGEVDDVTRNMNGTPGRSPSGLATYGTPIAASGQPADERMSWWQKLLLAIMDGVHGGLKKVGENRANELKYRSERLALSTAPENRPYVDWETRRAIERSAFNRANGYDSRLDDLILGNNRAPLTATPSGSSPSSPGTTTAITPRDVGPGSLRNPARVARLPRTRDPITGEERVIIDMPLGVDPVRPIR